MIDIEAHQQATRSLSTLLAKGDPHHTDVFYFGLARRLVANALLVRGYLADVVEGDRVVLRQQSTASLDEVGWLEEECHHLERELRDKSAMLAAARARRVPEHDPDAIGEREDDRRISTERADEKANADATGLAS